MDVSPATDREAHGTVAIRAATLPDDLPVLRALMAEYLLEYDPYGDPAQTWDDEYFSACTRHADQGDLAVLFACYDAAVIGFAIVRVESMWYRPGLLVGSFEELYVRAAYRRRGIARRMVAQGEALLRRVGATTWAAAVVEDNPSALSFWQAVGFEARIVRLYKA